MLLDFVARLVLLLLVVLGLSYWVGRRHWAVAAILSVIVLVAFMLLDDGFLVLGMLTVTVLCIVAILIHPNRPAFLVLTLSALTATTGMFANAKMAEVRALQALREDFPLESLKTRLTYEKTRPLPEVPDLSESVERHQDSEDSRSGSGRAWMLERLHDAAYEDFIRQPGLGVVRMRHVHRSLIELPPADAIPLLRAGMCFSPLDADEFPG